MDESQTFQPIKLAVKDVDVTVHGTVGPGIAIVAEDAGGHFMGITVSRELAALLDEFLPTSGPRFLAFWETYEADRGGDCFFWDLRRMADAIVVTSPRKTWAVDTRES